MSRSKKKNPYGGMTGAASEKDHKRHTHRKMRATERQVMATLEDEEDVHLPQKPRDVVNPWSGAKDGKQRFDYTRNPNPTGWTEEEFQAIKRKFLQK